MPGINTHKVGDMIINTTSTGPATKKLKMPTHAADLFETRVAELIASTTATDTTTEDLTSKINELEITIANYDAELREEAAKRLRDATSFDSEATRLNTVADQDGEIFDEDWSLDAAIASKELHDLRIKEQQALDDY